MSSDEASIATDSGRDQRRRPHLRAIASLEAFGLPIGWVAAMFVAPMILSFAVYWPHLHDYFVYDDFLFLQQVHTHGTWRAIVRAFTFPEATVFEVPTPWWRPTTDLVFQFEHAIFGLNPAPYHAFAFALHACIAGLGGLLVAKLSRSPVVGAITSVLFVVSPTYAYAVTWISNLTELFPAFMSLLAILAFYLFLTLEAQSRARLALAASVIALAIAMLGKESQILTGGLLFLLALVVRDRRRSVTDVAIAIGIAAAVALPIGIFAYVQESGPVFSERGFGTDLPLQLWRYLGRMSVPFGSREGANYVHLRATAAFIYLALGVTTIVTARRVPAFFFAWSIVVLVPFAVNASLFEPRYTYLSTLPFIAFWVTLGTMAAGGISDQWRERSSLALAIALPLAIVVLGNQTRQQQSRIGVQAAEYHAVVRATQEQCGDLPPGSHVYLLGSGADDPFQITLRAAINVFYEDVYVDRREPPAVPEPGRTCVVSVPAVPQ